MTNEEQKLREIAYKHAEPKVIWNDGNVSICPDEEKIESMLSDLTALISEGYYPKEFVEWVFREGIGSNDDGTLFHYVSIQIKGHPFKETKELTYNTTDELFNYWRENEQ